MCLDPLIKEEQVLSFIVLVELTSKGIQKCTLAHFREACWEYIISKKLFLVKVFEL